MLASKLLSVLNVQRLLLFLIYLDVQTNISVATDLIFSINVSIESFTAVEDDLIEKSFVLIFE